MKITKERAQALGLIPTVEDCRDCICSEEYNNEIHCSALNRIRISTMIQNNESCPELDDYRICNEMTEDEYDAYRHNRLEII